jgi:hypothetical protein
LEWHYAGHAEALGSIFLDRWRSIRVIYKPLRWQTEKENFLEITYHFEMLESWGNSAVQLLLL